MSGDRWDVAVVGGGIVGLATARALQRRGVGRLIVLEAEDELGVHQTGRNSGVIHSGLFYRPGSAKARLCTQGRVALYRFLRRHSIPHRRTGKLVVATRPGELPRLEELLERGRANGLRGLRRLECDELEGRYREVKGIAALEVQETGIVDFRVLARALADELRGGGARVRTAARLTGVRRRAGGLTLGTVTGGLSCRYLVSCAGLQADRVARMSGLETDLRIVPFRGRYFTVSSPPDVLRRMPVYPVSDPTVPFLGVHFTPDLQGRVEAGPTAILALDREGYSPTDVSLRDVAEMLAFPGFWRMAARHWRRAMHEASLAANPQRFVEEARQLVPRLSRRQIRRGRAGVRAQAVDRAGSLVDDFRVVEGDRTLHVLNAPSPAATSALAIGEAVAKRAVADWDVGEA